MKILKFIKKNYKRLIIQVVSIISAFVIFSISASADTFDYSINMPISKPNITENVFYVEVLYNNGVSGELDIFSFTDTNEMDSQPLIYIEYISPHTITFSSNDLLPKLNCFWITSAGNCGVYNGNGGSITITYPNIRGIKFYGNFEWKSTSSSIPTAYSWNFNYSSDAVAINQLNTIIGLLQSQNSSNNQINESVEQSANQISGSIEDSTNEILNGGADKPDIDTSGVDNHNKNEEQIIQSSETGLNAAKDMFNQEHLGIFQNFGVGLLAASEVINTFVGVNWLGDIIDMSMIFGMFAFIAGMSVLVIKSVGGKH